jgi:hypothetical protein
MEKDLWLVPSLTKANLVVPPGALSPRVFVFYGAARIEAPKIGSRFRRSGTTFQVLGVRPERTRSRELARSWKFMTECQSMPLWDY